MRCPVCYYKNTRVSDSREVDDGRMTRRRRVCKKCRFRFSTYEEMEFLTMVVKKRDGTIEPYNREKLEKGIRLSLEKRPVEEQVIIGVVAKIEKQIAERMHPVKRLRRGHERVEREIESHVIGDLVVEALRKLDDVAYLRFASVFKSFDNVKAFRKEILELQK